MSEDDQTTTADQPADEPSLESLDPTQEVDDAASSFIDLETQFVDRGPGVEPGTYGQVIDAARVEASAVPEDYPRKIDTETVVALELALPDGRERTAFFAWPEEDDSELARLLAALEIPRESFAKLYGKRLLLTVEGGYVLPEVPDTLPRGSDSGYYGVAGGLAFNLLFLFGLAAGISAVSSGGFVMAFLLVNLLAIPMATALDAWHLRSSTDWDQGPWFWAMISAIPVFNMAVVAAYLYFRRGVRPLSPD